jgi:hypothetical protein
MVEEDGAPLIDDEPSMAQKMPETMSMNKPHFSSTALNANEKMNWLIHVLFLR